MRGVSLIDRVKYDAHFVSLHSTCRFMRKLLSPLFNLLDVKATMMHEASGRSGFDVIVPAAQCRRQRDRTWDMMIGLILMLIIIFLGGAALYYYP